jgi:mRNA interferase MazF
MPSGYDWRKAPFRSGTTTLTPNTTTIRQGQIVLVPFPFSNEPETNKRRPALVISANWYNQSKPDCILAAITSVVPPELSQDEVLLSGAEAKQCGLLNDSIIRTGKLFTIEQGRIVRQLGQITLVARQRTFEALNRLFNNNLSTPK